MAGDWIKIRPTLLTHPKVNGIARFLENDQAVSRVLSTGFNGGMSEIVTRNVMRNVTIASLVTVWGAANEHTSDGVFKNADLLDIDDITGIPNFGRAMASVGWAVYDCEKSTVTFPNFSEYNTCGKDRTKEANRERQRRYREKQKESKEKSNDKSNVTDNVTNNDREEKRREDKDKPVGKPSGPVGIKTFLSNCKEKSEQPIKSTDPIFDYTEDAGIPDGFVRLCWLEFVERNMASGKRQKDWRAAFRNCIRGNWYKLWWLDGDEYKLTTTGKQAEIKHRNTGRAA